MRPAGPLLLVALSLAATLVGCPTPACDDCFSVELGDADGSWGHCCDYTRANADDPLLVRLVRVEGADPYTAGLAVGCAWDADSPPYEPLLVTVDGVEVDGWTGFGVDFAGAGADAVVSVDCDPARPPPQWPLVLLNLLDEDLAAQFDPAAADDEAALVLTPIL